MVVGPERSLKGFSGLVSSNDQEIVIGEFRLADIFKGDAPATCEPQHRIARFQTMD